MEPIFTDRKRRTIKIREELKFSSYSSFHIIKLTARSKGEKQLGPDSSDDEDLTLTLDGQSFPKLHTKADLIDSPAAFSGGSLHGLAKTIYLLVFLKGRSHTLILNTDNPSGTAGFDELEVYTFRITDTLRLDVLHQAEDGDRRPWITFTLVDLPLQSVYLELKLERRLIDSDDVKIVIDEKVQLNYRNLFRKLWYFIASVFSGGSQNHTFLTSLSTGLHYIELFSDRMPILNNAIFSFGTNPLVPPGIPSVDNPKSTGDFYVDTEDMILARLIFCEAEDQSVEAKAWVGGSILNRVKSKAWPNTLHGVILQKGQYDPVKQEDPNHQKFVDPLNNAGDKRIRAWQESYEISRNLLSGKTANPTEATHFHGRGVTKEWFLVNVVPQGKLIRIIDDTYFYWSPN